MTILRNVNSMKRMWKTRMDFITEQQSCIYKPAAQCNSKVTILLLLLAYYYYYYYYYYYSY